MVDAALDVADIVAIQQVLHLYGKLVDTSAWDEMDRVYTHDAVFDISDFKMGVMNGLDEIIAMFRSSKPPSSVHIVNVVVEPGDGPDQARAYSKNLGILAKGAVGSGAYDDVLVRTPKGWRVKHRVAILRRTERS